MYRKLQIGLALAGFSISLYLTLTAYSCADGCSVIHSSKYAYIGGVPVAWLGVLGYAAIGLAVFYQHQLLKPLVAVGTLFELWLLYAQMFLLHAFCPWCMASFAVMMLLFAFTFAGSHLILALAAIIGAFILVGIISRPASETNIAFAEYRTQQTNDAQTKVLPGNSSGFSAQQTENTRQEAVQQVSAVQESRANPYPEPIRVVARTAEKESDAIKVVDESVREQTISLQKPILFFAPWCSHCLPALQEVKKLPADRRPLLVYGYPEGDIEKSLKDAREKVSSVGLTDAVYVCLDDLHGRINELPSLMWKGKVYAGNNALKKIQELN